MITITKASKDDAEELLAVKIDAFSEDVKLYGYGPDEYGSLEKQIAIFDKKYVRYFKISNDNKIIGGLCVYVRENKHYHLAAIYIAQDYQNMGIGSKAFEFLFKEFDDAKKWTLDTPYLSFRNHHFYEKLKFIKVGETAPESDGFYLFLYEKCFNNN